MPTPSYSAQTKIKAENTTLLNSAEYTELVGYPVIIGIFMGIVFALLAFTLIIIVWIKTRKRNEEKGYTICLKQESSDLSKVECCNNTVYETCIDLKASTSVVLQPQDDDYIKSVELPIDEEIKPATVQMSRKRTSSCPELMDECRKINVHCEQLNLPTSNHEYVYLDTSKFMSKIEEIKKHRSANDISLLKVTSGTSYDKFKRSLNALNASTDIPRDNFAAYMILGGSDLVYKVPSGVRKYDPPNTKPPRKQFKETLADIRTNPYRYKKNVSNATNKHTTMSDGDRGMPWKDGSDSERYVTNKNTYMDTYVDMMKDNYSSEEYSIYEKLNTIERGAYDKLHTGDSSTVYL